jgi:uncharacterized protein
VAQPFAPTIPVSQAPPEVRTSFMTGVYARLMIGIAAFVLLQWWLFASGLAYTIAEFVLRTNWLLILGGFIIVSWLSTGLIARARGAGAQYAAYGAVVVANALLFATPLVLAAEFGPPGTIELAAQISVVAFAVLSVIAIRTSKDFSFLRGLLLWGGFLALALIVLAVLTPMQLGVWFSVAMIGFAGAAILYDTQKVYRSYPPGSEIAAAVNLFSSIALLFWYVLRLLTSRN